MDENRELTEEFTEEELATVSGGTGTGCDPLACRAKGGTCIGGVCHPGMGK